MNEQEQVSENAASAPADDLTPLEPMDAAKTAMLEAVEQFRETVATPRPVERIDWPAKEGVEEPVDLNTATEEELGRLPGIGPTLAARIVEHRTTIRRFDDPAGLVAVPGISHSLYERLAPRLVASPAGDEVIMVPTLDLEAPESVAEAAEQAATETIDLEALTVEEDVDMEKSFAVAAGMLGPDLAEPAAEEIPVLYPPAWSASEPSSDTERSWTDVAATPEPPPEALDSEEEPLLDREIEAAWEAEVGAPDWAVDVPDLGEVPIQEPAPEVPRAEAQKAQEPAQPESKPIEKEKARPRPPEPPIVEVVSPSGAGCWRLLIVGVLSALAGAALALLALVLLNRTLDFRTQTNQVVQAEAVRMNGRMDTLGGELGDVQAQLDAMRGLAARVEEIDNGLQRLGENLATFQTELARFGEELGSTQAAVGDLSGRTEELGRSVNTLQEEMQDLAAHLAEIADHVAVLSEQVEILQKATQRFDAFLEGLRGLLKEVEGPATPTPWPTALRPIPNTPTPIVVTVIPQATPTP